MDRSRALWWTGAVAVACAGGTLFNTFMPWPLILGPGLVLAMLTAPNLGRRAVHVAATAVVFPSAATLYIFTHDVGDAGLGYGVYTLFLWMLCLLGAGVAAAVMWERRPSDPPGRGTSER